MANVIYNSFKRDIMNGGINLASDTIKVALVTSTYVPNIDTHAKFSDITNEVVGSGYTAGGKTLATPLVSVDNATDKGIFDAVDLSWTTSTITARGAVIYKSRGGAATADELIGYLDFLTDKISTAGDFNLLFNALGIINAG
jgi:hypothetical protein